MTDEPAIDALWPNPAMALTDEQIIERLANPPGAWLSANFVSSLDGAGTHNGLSAGLGGAADQRVFALLRRPAHAVLVGAGTVRKESYGPMRLDAPSVAWRQAAGLPAHPVFAIVSGRLDLDPRSRIFTDAPVRPIVVTTASSPTDKRESLGEVADIILAGDDELDARLMLSELTGRGLLRVHNEGGPSLFGTLLAADVVDELSITVSPVIEGGDAARIVSGDLPEVRRLRLAGVLASESTLLLRYERDRSIPGF
jgi:riboflavin biosynthesis pyrimidine reductase